MYIHVFVLSCSIVHLALYCICSVSVNRDREVISQTKENTGQGNISLVFARKSAPPDIGNGSGDEAGLPPDDPNAQGKK